MYNRECMTKNALKPSTARRGKKTTTHTVMAWSKFFGKLKARNKISLLYLLSIELARKK